MNFSDFFWIFLPIFSTYLGGHFENVGHFENFKITKLTSMILRVIIHWKPYAFICLSIFFRFFFWIFYILLCPRPQSGLGDILFLHRFFLLFFFQLFRCPTHCGNTFWGILMKLCTKIGLNETKPHYYLNFSKWRPSWNGGHFEC